MTRMSTWPRSGLLHLRPGLIDPGIGRGRFSLGPAGRRRDVADGDGDDPVRIQDRERILRHVLAEAGDRVLVPLVVVGTDVDVASRPGDHHALELADDGLVIRPAAHQLVGLLDGGLERVGGGVCALGLEVRVLVELRLVLLDEGLVRWPPVPRRIGEVVVGVHAGQHAFRMVLAHRLGRGAERERGGHLHLFEQSVLERLLVEGVVVAAPERGDEEVGLGGQRLGDVRREVRGEELGPGLGDVLRLGQQLLGDDAEMIEAIAPVGVVGVDVRDLLHVGPGQGHPHRARRSVRRLDVGDAEDVARVGTALSKRKSVQPSTNMVRSFSSSATGPSAGLFPLDVMPMNRSIFSESLSRRISLVFASVPAASSALRISIFRLPRSPPCALISSAASRLPLYMGSPSTAPAPVKKVIWPILKGLSGMVPFGLSWAWATPARPEPAMEPPMAAAEVTPSLERKSRRVGRSDMRASSMRWTATGRPRALTHGHCTSQRWWLWIESVVTYPARSQRTGGEWLLGP